MCHRSVGLNQQAFTHQTFSFHITGRAVPSAHVLCSVGTERPASVRLLAVELSRLRQWEAEGQPETTREACCGSVSYSRAA